MKDGTIFAGLNHYREGGYIEEYQEIAVITSDGKALICRVFAVRATSIADTVYTLWDNDWGAVENHMSALDAPEHAARFLVLSTCTSGGNDDEHLLIFAAAE